MTRRSLLTSISNALGERALIWSGLRGSDADSLGDLPQYQANLTIIDAYDRRPLSQSLAYEQLSGRREDMEAWDIADHLAAPAAQEFRHAMLQETVAPCALLPYRASRFLSSIWFARQDRCMYLGIFGEAQTAFEHKPWVEWSLGQRGIPGLSWQYVADEEQLKVRDHLADGPVMLRRSQSSGGSGFSLVTTEEELREAWPRQEEAFVGISRFLTDTTPINVGAVVWPDTTTVHHASIQLIGIPEAVTRRFGYCGNDFAAAKDLSAEVLGLIEAYTREVGSWLRSQGFLGAFGVDFLLHEGQPRFVEINPRFQGSTAASSRLSIEAGLPCLLLEHVAAHLGLPSVQRPPLAEQVGQARDLSQLIVHWVGERDATVDSAQLGRSLEAIDPKLVADVLAPADVTVARGGTVARMTTRGGLHSADRTLPSPWRDALSEWTNRTLEAVHDER